MKTLLQSLLLPIASAINLSLIFTGAKFTSTSLVPSNTTMTIPVPITRDKDCVVSVESTGPVNVWFVGDEDGKMAVGDWGKWVGGRYVFFYYLFRLY